MGADIVVENFHQYSFMLLDRAELAPAAGSD
jgi:hypothetical protein